MRQEIDENGVIVIVRGNGVKNIKTQLMRILLKTWRAALTRDEKMVEKLLRKLKSSLPWKKQKFVEREKQGGKQEDLVEVLVAILPLQEVAQAAVGVVEAGNGTWRLRRTTSRLLHARCGHCKAGSISSL